MLTMLIGTDWVANRDYILQQIRKDTEQKLGNRILLVPELISHNMERLLCQWAGDTVSRYAEVLSFRRLEGRLSEEKGIGTLQCLDNGGRLAAIALAARNLHSKVKVFAGMETKPEFLSDLLNTIDEMKQCCISANDIQTASLRTEGSFAQKLLDLSVLMDMYEGICRQGKRDPRDRMNWTFDQLKNSSYGQKHTLYVDGFPDFTRQHMAIIEYFIETSPDFTISLCCDSIGSRKQGFEKAGQTAAAILTYAKKHGIPYTVTVIPPRNSSLALIYPMILNGKTKTVDSVNDRIFVYSCSSVYAECAMVMENIIEHIEAGQRYRDHAVACTDMMKYKPVLELLASQYKIPIYLSGTDDILSKPVISTLLSALDCALGDMNQKDVLRYLKSSLSPIDMDSCDLVENYVIAWGIRGNKWFSKWENHPDGLNEEWTDSSRALLERINKAREIAVNPLHHLRDSIGKAASVRDQVEGLNAFLREIHFRESLESLAEDRIQNGDLRSAQIYQQLWEIILKALEQLYDILGDANWDGDHFSRLLSLLLSQYDVGTIPSVLDSVIAGSVADMRGHRTKYLYVLGAQEGQFPSYSTSAGILTDHERIALRQLGVPISGVSLDKLQAELGDIYTLFCGADEKITVCNSGGQFAAIVRRLCVISGGEKQIPMLKGIAVSDRVEAGIYLASMNAEQEARNMRLEKEFEKACSKQKYSLGKLDSADVQGLYGKTLKLSASQIDRMASCYFSYFMQYGLRAKTRQEITIDPTDFGSYVHSVLEDTAKQVMKEGGFQKVSLEDTLKMADMYSETYIKNHFSILDSERVLHLLKRNRQEIMLVVQDLWEELSQSQFRPVGFEVGFGDGQEMNAVAITSGNMNAILRGFVDRIDVYENDGKHYFRVVDYKTGNKEFDYCDVYNGVGLQMLLYLFALLKEGKKIVGDNPYVSGVQYFPAKVDVISCYGSLSDEEAIKERQKKWKRSGLLLKNDSVLLAMENTEKPQRLMYTRNKDGALSGNLADPKQWDLLEKYVNHFLGSLVDTIASGCIQANPYTRGEMHDPCTFCPYGTVCHCENVPERRSFRKMDADEFWSDLEREVKKNV